MKMLPVFPSNLNLDNTNIQHNQRQQQSGSTTPKRNSGMIFRIEHLLPISSPTSTPPSVSTAIVTSAIVPFLPTAISQLQSTAGGISSLPTTTPSNNGTRRLKSSRTGGVYLKHFAPKDTVSESISSLALIAPCSTGGSTAAEQTNPQSAQQQNMRTYVSVVQGILHLTPLLMRKVKLSEDIYSYNALFEVFHGEVRIRIVRDVTRDEELIVWFDEEVTLLMSIPFLTPMNIHGNNRYTCHHCNLTFETPNPLKIHLALACGRHTLDILWIRLHYTLNNTALSQHSLPLHLIHHLPTTSTTRSSSSTINIPSISPVSSLENQRLSAFKPISSTNNTQIRSTAPSSSSSAIIPITTASLSLPSTSQHSTSANTIPLMPSISTAATLSSMNLWHPPANGPLNAAAQIEAIVSNMGVSKQGHLCIYCGKVYSRKYGLKIHIRTHTGFKPLKCKFCLRPFGDPSNLNKHVRLHQQLNTRGSSGETLQAESYKCHMCHKTLARRRDLQRHIESRHGNAS